LRAIVKAAEAARAFTSERGPGKRRSRAFDEEVLLLTLTHAAQAAEHLAPLVRAMRPEAPWLSVGILRHIDPSRTRLAEVPVLGNLMANEIQALGKAAAQIIAELDEAGLTAPAPTVAPAALYQFKVTLAEITPPIWRRLLLPNTSTLRRLHLAIQIAGGWWNYHLHLFEIAGTEYGYPDPDGVPGFRSDAHVKLCALPLRAGSRFRYVYDFGDYWEHEILLEKVLPLSEGPAWPVCLAGERGFPHEDSGGVPGYYHTLRILRMPRHPEHEEMRTWTGPHYDPEGLDLDFVNEQLRTGKHRVIM